LHRDKLFWTLAVPVMDAADGALSRLAPNMLRWEQVILHVTTHCNSRCVMCRYEDRYHSDKDLDTNAWKKIIHGFESFGLKTILFTGGEPLLREDFLEIARACNGTRSINTNGILVEYATAPILAELFETVNVSLDGSTREIYERVRGADHFHRVVRNLRYLKEAGARLKLHCQINRHNYHDVLNIARIAEALSVEIVFSLVVYGGFNHVYGTDRSLRKEIDFERLKDLMEEVLTYDQASTWISLRDCMNGKLQHRCYAHIGGPLIDPVGRVYVCCGDLPPIGNVVEDPPESLWSRYRGMRSRLLWMQAPPCRNCLFYMGNFEYLQRGVKHLMTRSLRRRLKRHPLYLRVFLAGR